MSSCPFRRTITFTLPYIGKCSESNIFELELMNSVVHAVLMALHCGHSIMASVALPYCHCLSASCARAIIGDRSYTKVRSISIAILSQAEHWHTGFLCCRCNDCPTCIGLCLPVTDTHADYRTFLTHLMAPTDGSYFWFMCASLLCARSIHTHTLIQELSLLMGYATGQLKDC